MLAIFNPEMPDWITRDTVEAFAEANPEEANAIRAIKPGCAIAVPFGGGGFNVIVHETENYKVACTDGQYHGIQDGRPEPIEWEAL